MIKVSKTTPRWQLPPDQGRHAEKGLIFWRSPTESVEANLARVEIDLASDETGRPQGVNGEGATDQGDTPAVVAATKGAEASHTDWSEG